MEIDRKSGIGGSEVAAVMGLSPWAGPLQVYTSKVGLAASEDSTLPMRVGSALEKFILGEYSTLMNIAVGHNITTYRHPKYPWRLATPDGFAGNGNVIKWGVEAKAVSSPIGWGEGPEDVPTHYLLQALWYRNVMSDILGIQIPWWDIVVLISNKEIRTYRIEENSELELTMLEAVDRFWLEHVEKLNPPPVTSHVDRKILALLYSDPVQDVRPATPEEEELVSCLKGLWEQREKINVSYDLMVAKLQERIGNASGILSSYGKILWSKTTDVEQVDWKAVASELNPSEELIKKHTKTRAGTRRFIVPRAWSNIKD